MFGKKSKCEIKGFIDKRYHMHRIRCDLAVPNKMLIGSGDGPFSIIGGNGKVIAADMRVGDAVVVMAPCNNSCVEVYERVRILEVKPPTVKGEFMVVRKDNGEEVELKMPFVVIPMLQYMKYWTEVDGWEHEGADGKLEGRCPVYTFN